LEIRKLKRRLVCAFVTIGLGSAAAQAAPQKVVIYQAFQSLLYLPLYVGIDEGIFAKHGLNVVKVTAGSGAAGVAAVLGGNAAFSLQDPMTAVLANLKGASMINVAIVVNGAPVWIVVPKASSLKSVKQLASKSVATAIPPSTSTYLLQRRLKLDKIDASMNTVLIGTELAPMMAGRSAASAVYEPQLEEGIAGGDRILYSFTKHYPGGYAFSTIDMLKSTGEKKPAMVTAFVTALGEAEHLLHASPKVTLDVAEKEFPTLPKSVVEAAVARMVKDNVYPTGPAITPAAFKNALDLQIFVGNIKPGQVTYAEEVDPQFAK
jgi:NitT/TauT family transport system substrate-binding protein